MVPLIGLLICLRLVGKGELTRMHRTWKPSVTWDLLRCRTSLWGRGVGASMSKFTAAVDWPGVQIGMGRRILSTTMCEATLILHESTVTQDVAMSE